MVEGAHATLTALRGPSVGTVCPGQRWDLLPPPHLFLALPVTSATRLPKENPSLLTAARSERTPPLQPSLLCAQTWGVLVAVSVRRDTLAAQPRRLCARWAVGPCVPAGLWGSDLQVMRATRQSGWAVLSS